MNRRTALVLAIVLFAVTPAAAQTTTSHGIAMHGDLKYPAGFRHFDYVNPDAPKGGAVRLSARGGFDTFNPYVIKGRPAAGVGLRVAVGIVRRGGGAAGSPSVRCVVIG